MIDPSSTPRLWHIDAYKYDQRLHYTLPAHFMHDDGDLLWLRAEAGMLLRHVTRGFARPMRRRSDMYFWRDAWYNVYLNYDDAGHLSHAYCNVGLPPTITEQTVSFVDLDLDIRFWPDGRIEVLDEDEFADHARQFNYPPEVQRRARAVLDQLVARWHDRTPPFDRLDGAR